jgi:hypothetical protein
MLLGTQWELEEHVDPRAHHLGNLITNNPKNE